MAVVHFIRPSVHLPVNTRRSWARIRPPPGKHVGFCILFFRKVRIMGVFEGCFSKVSVHLPSTSVHLGHFRFECQLDREAGERTAGGVTLSTFYRTFYPSHRPKLGK